MAHALDRPVASDLSYLVIQKRRDQREFGPQVLDSVNKRLYPLPSQMVERHAFFADRETVEDDTDASLWEQRRGRKRQR